MVFLSQIRPWIGLHFSGKEKYYFQSVLQAWNKTNNEIIHWEIEDREKENKGCKKMKGKNDRQISRKTTI